MISATAILAVMGSLYSELPSHRQSGSYPQGRGSIGAAHAKRSAKRRSNIRARSKK
jgi:hypothetical protein